MVVAVLATGAARAADEPSDTLSSQSPAAPDTRPGRDVREPKAIITLQVENDFFSRWAKSDRDYTNGLRIGWLSSPTPIPDWLVGVSTLPSFIDRRKADTVVRRWGISLGQNLYTPEDTSVRTLIPTDRPYAAWLYVGFTLQYTHAVGDQPVRLDTLELDLGVVGPAAGGRFVQNNFHTLIGGDKARGWHNQLHNEPTLDIGFERRWRVGRRELPLGLETDVIPRVGLAVGNVATYGSVGGVLRIGQDLRNDFGPPRARPAMPGSETFTARDDFAWYFFVGFDGQAHARNIFLDGNTFRDSHHVDRNPFVLDVQAGFAFLFRNARVSLTHVLRSPEFSERHRWQQFGSISIAFRY